MGDRVWVCTRDPLLELFSATMQPSVILMIMFAGLTFGVWRRERWRRVVHDLWRNLLFAGLLVCAFFLSVALLARFAFGADPSPILRWVPVARGAAAGVSGWLVWRRRDSASQLLPAPRWWFRLRWAVLGFAFAIAVRPWIPNTNWLLSGPYEIVEALIDFPTVYIASDECLAARVLEYEVVNHSVSSFVGQPARDELEFRGAAAVPGMARLLSQQLELDALRPGFRRRHKSNFYGRDTADRIAQRAVFGAAFLITQIAKQGGAEPVLQTWAERGPSPALRAKAAMALECVQLNRQRVLNAYSASCAAPGEVCTGGRCSKIFGERCSAGIECFSNTCEAGHCCQPIGLSCTGPACCAPGSCVAGQCTVGPASGGAPAR